MTKRPQLAPVDARGSVDDKVSLQSAPAAPRPIVQRECSEPGALGRGQGAWSALAIQLIEGERGVRASKPEAQFSLHDWSIFSSLLTLRLATPVGLCSCSAAKACSVFALSGLTNSRGGIHSICFNQPRMNAMLMASVQLSWAAACDCWFSSTNGPLVVFAFAISDLVA